MAPGMVFSASTPATYQESPAAPLSDQQDAHQSSKGVGIAIGIAILVALLVSLSTLMYFCIRRQRMIHSRNSTQCRRIQSQAVLEAKPYPAPPPYERESSADPFAREGRASMNRSTGRVNSWATYKGTDEESMDYGYGTIHVAMPPSLAEHPAHAYLPGR